MSVSDAPADLIKQAEARARAAEATLTPEQKETRQRLVTLSDQLNHIIRDAEDKLNVLSLGVEVWIPLDPDDLESVSQIGYTKLPVNPFDRHPTLVWGIAVRSASTEYRDRALRNVDRLTRLEAVPRLAALTAAVIQEARKLIDRLASTLPLVEESLKGIKL